MDAILQGLKPESFAATFSARLNGLLKNGVAEAKLRTQFLQGLKPPLSMWHSSARLKSCPCYKAQLRRFFSKLFGRALVAERAAATFQQAVKPRRGWKAQLRGFFRQAANPCLFETRISAL